MIQFSHVRQEITSMNQRSRLPLPRALTMPLRDVLRGVTSVADVTEEVLEPAAALLPGPVQATFRSALATIEGAGSRAVTPVIDHGDIDRASAFLQGSDTSREALETFVNVLTYVWERSLSKNADHPHILFSETIATASLMVKGRGEAASSYARTAAILMALRQANAASRLPGTPIAPSDDERAFIDQTLLSGCVWLLSDRAPDLAEEERLLDLASTLVQALAGDVAAGFADQDLLAEHLQSLADHL